MVSKTQKIILKIMFNIIIFAIGYSCCVPCYAGANHFLDMISEMEDVQGHSYTLQELFYKRNMIIAVLPVSQSSSISAISNFINNFNRKDVMIFLINTEDFISESECKKILKEQSIDSKLILVSKISGDRSLLLSHLEQTRLNFYLIDRSGNVREYSLKQENNISNILKEMEKVFSVKKVMHTVKKGESLSKIAVKYFSSFCYWTNIYKANRDRIRDPTVIYPGQVLIIPLE